MEGALKGKDFGKLLRDLVNLLCFILVFSFLNSLAFFLLCFSFTVELVFRELSAIVRQLQAEKRF